MNDRDEISELGHSVPCDAQIADCGEDEEIAKDCGESDDENEDENEDEQYGPSEDKDYIYYRLDRLLKHDPTLNCRAAFIAKSREDFGNAHRTRFERRFQAFIRRANRAVSVPPEILDFLYRQSATTQARLAAWDATIHNLESPEFGEVLEYLRARQKYFNALTKEFSHHQPKNVPTGCATWMRYRIKAFQEFVEDTEATLRLEVRSMKSLHDLRKLGREDLESQFLFATHVSLRKLIPGTSVRRNLTLLIGAYAYGARLIPQGGKDSNFEGLVRQRLRRAKSNNRFPSTVLYAQLIHG
jgi:hypothetical protein